MKAQWVNPYLAERKSKTKRKQVTEIKSKSTTDQYPRTAEEAIELFKKFQTGIKEISASFQQVEKTIDSLAGLINTFEKIGGMERFNKLLANTQNIEASSYSRGRTGNAHPLQGLIRLLKILEKVDFEQINQFLTSPMIQSFLSESDQKGKN